MSKPSSENLTLDPVSRDQRERSKLASRTIAIGLLSIFAPGAFPASLITDEPTRVEALRAIFPKMPLALIPGKRIDSSTHLTGDMFPMSAPDALKDENVYSVTGPPTDDDDERCIAMDVPNPEKPSDVREVRMRLFRTADDRFVAAVQYSFAGIQSPFACVSIGKLVLLRSVGAQLKSVREMKLETGRHHAIQSVAFYDFGDGDTLVIESDAGGAGAFETDLFVLKVTRENIQTAFITTSRLYMSIEDENLVTTLLDFPRTKAAKGTRYCFVITTYIRKDRHFAPPEIRRECFAPKR